MKKESERREIAIAEGNEQAWAFHKDGLTCRGTAATYWNSDFSNRIEILGVALIKLGRFQW